jgi:hypothetical protein
LFLITNARSRGAALGVLAMLVLLPACGGSSAVDRILDLSASGAQNTAPFTTRTAWDLTYSWDCATQKSRGVPEADRFGFALYNADDDSLAAQQGQTARTGRSGSGTLHYSRSGPYYVQVNSVCDWRLQVLGRA